MSGTQVSSFAPANILFDAASGATTASVQNQLLRNDLLAKLAPYQVQQAQQQTGEAETEMLARAASGLLDPKAYPDEASRAAAYPSVVADLQRLGFAKNAPSIYPGEAALRRVQQMGLSLKDQYQIGLVTTPGYDAAVKAATAPLGQSGAGGPAGGTTDNNFGNIRPTGASSGFNTYATPQDGVAAMSSNLAAYATQHGIKTLNGLTARWAPLGDGNNNPTAYAASLGKALGLDPNAEINLADPLLQSRLIPAMAQIEKGKPFGQPPEVLMAGIQAGLGGKGGQQAAAAPQAAPGAAAQLAPVQVAGPGAPTPSTATAAPAADLVGPRPLPPIGPTSPVVTPQSLANTPAPVAQNALLPAPPTGAPSMPVPQPIPMATGGAAQPTPPAAGSPPPTGTQSPQFQAAMELARRAQVLEAAPDPTGRLKALAAGLRSQAALYMQADSTYVDPVTGIQTKAISGAQTSAAEGRKNYTETAPGVFTAPGQAPTFAPTGRPVEGVGPDPNDPSKQVPGHWISQSGTRTFFPAATESPQAGYTVRQEAYKRDSAKVDDYAKVGQQAQSDQVRIQEMQDQLDRIYTGPGSGTKVAMQAWAERWLPASISSQFSQQVDGMSDAAASQVFNKLAFRNATTQERGVLGARGGALATKMFVQSNPGMELLTDSNKRMLKVMQVANQADIDYTQGALAHFGDNEKQFAESGGKQYDSLTTYERQWQAQRNPQVYAAAAGALAGLPPKDGEINGVKVHGWATGLSDTEYERALNIVSRADPRAVVQGKTGRLSMQPANTQTATPPTVTGADAAHPPLPPGFTVVQ